MDKKVRMLDRALRAVFPKTYKALRNHIIKEYEYDTFGDPYEGYDDEVWDEDDRIDDSEAQAEWERQALQDMEDEIAFMHNEELARLEDERICREREREAERRTNNVRQLCIDDPSLADIYRSYLDNSFDIEEAEAAVEHEVERRKAERTQFLDNVIGKISTEGLEAAMQFYKDNEKSP